MRYSNQHIGQILGIDPTTFKTSREEEFGAPRVPQTPNQPTVRPPVFDQPSEPGWLDDARAGAPGPTGELDVPNRSMVDLLSESGLIQNAEKRSAWDPRSHMGHFAGGVVSGVAGVASGAGGAMRWGDQAIGDDPNDEGLGKAGEQLTEYSGRVNEAVRPAVDIVSRAFEDPKELANPRFWSAGAGTAVGSMLALAPALVGGAKAAAAAGLGAIGVGVVGAATAGVFESIIEGGVAYDEALAEGASDEEAASRAAKVAAQNVGLNAVTNVAGFGRVLGGALKGKAAKEAANGFIGRLIGKASKHMEAGDSDDITALVDRAERILRGPSSRVGQVAVGALAEGGQEVGQEMIQNVAADRPTFEGAHVAFPLGAMGGGGMAATLGAAAAAPPPAPTPDPMPPANKPILAPPTPKPELSPELELAPEPVIPEPVAPEPAPEPVIPDPLIPEPAPVEPTPAPDPIEVKPDETLDDANDEAKAPDVENPPPLETAEQQRAAVRGAVSAEVGETGTAAEFDPDELEVDASRFQFKGDVINDSGETGILSDVKVWDPMSSGMAVVWIDKGGTNYIVDGHQRLGLAKRLKSEGQEPTITARILREDDGITSPQARAIAAIKNINEGSGTAVDVSRALRDAPDTVDTEKFSKRRAIVRQGMMMRDLDEGIIRQVEKGTLSNVSAAVIGEEVEDVDMQWRMADEFTKHPPATETEARQVARQMLGFVLPEKTTQETLFGTVEVTEDIYRERGQVLTKALSTLKQDAKLFGSLEKNRSTIESAGNVLDAATNKRIVEGANVAETVLERLSLVKGPISDALTAAALKVKHGTAVATAAREFNEDVRKRLDKGGIAGLESGEGKPASEPAFGLAAEGQEVKADEESAASPLDFTPEGLTAAPAESDFSATEKPSGPGLFGAEPETTPAPANKPVPKPAPAPANKPIPKKAVAPANKPTPKAKAPTAKPSRAAAPTVRRLPDDLRGARPRYNYGLRSFQLAFVSDVDKALYITAQKKTSKRDADYRGYLEGQGMTPAQITAGGAEVRDRIKALVKDRKKPGLVGVPVIDRPGGDSETMALPRPSGQRAGIGRTTGTPPLDKPANQPAPTTAATPPPADLRPMEIVKRVADSMKVPISYGKAGPGALASFRSKVNAIRLAVRGDAASTLHELGHAVDMTLGNWSGAPRVDYVEELAELGAPTSGASYSPTQVRREGVAEFVRVWMVDSTAAAEAAPKFNRVFEDWIATGHPVARAFTQAREELRAYHRLTPDQQGEVQMASGREPNRGIRAGLRRFYWKPGETAERAATRLQVGLNDQYYGLRKIDELIGVTDPALGLAAKFHMLGGMSGRAATFFLHGVRRDNFEKTSPGLMSALDKLGSEEKQQQFRKYLVARRGARAHEHNLVTGLTDETIAEWQSYGADPDIAAATKVYDEFRSALLDYATDKGILKPEMRDAWEKRWGGAYAPLKRVKDAQIDPASGERAANATWRNGLKVGRRFFGSKETILDPIISTIEDTFEFVQRAEQNEAMRTLVETLKDVEGSGQWLQSVPPDQNVTRVRASEVKDAYADALRDQGLEDEQIKAILEDPTLDRQFEIYRPALQATGPKRLMTYLDTKGDRKWVEVKSDELWGALNAMSPTTTSHVIKALRGFASLARATATLNLPFMVRAVQRDVTQAAIYAPRGMTPADWVKGAKSAVQQDEDLQLYMFSGASQSNYIAIDVDLMKRAKRQASDRGIVNRLSTVANPFELLRASREIAEIATRVGAGARHRRLWEAEGEVMDEAMVQRLAYGMRNWTQNFQKQGTWLRDWNQISMFLTSRVGGWTLAAEQVARNPKQVLSRVAPLVAASAALWYLHRDDDLYDEIPEHEKQLYWHIPLPQAARDAGYDPFVRIVKPFEWGDAVSQLEVGLDKAWGTGDNRKFAVEGMGEAAWMLVDWLMPTAFLPVLEVGANYDFFRERNIVSPFDKGLEPELQYSQWTSETSKRLGKLMGYSPSKLDHIILGYTTGVGRMLLSASDTVVNRVAGEAPRPEPQIPFSDLGVKAFRTGLMSGRASIEDFYEEFDRIEGLAGSVRRYWNGAEFDEAEQVAKTNNLVVKVSGGKVEVSSPMLSRMRTARRQMRDMRPYMDHVYNSFEMTSVEKRARLNVVALDMVNLARMALNKGRLDDTSTLQTMWRDEIKKEQEK